MILYSTRMQDGGHLNLVHSYCVYGEDKKMQNIFLLKQVVNVTQKHGLLVP